MLGNQQFLQAASWAFLHLQWINGEVRLLSQGSHSINALLLVRVEWCQLCSRVHLMNFPNNRLGYWVCRWSSRIWYILHVGPRREGELYISMSLKAWNVTSLTQGINCQSVIAFFLLIPQVLSPFLNTWKKHKSKILFC